MTLKAISPISPELMLTRSPDLIAPEIILLESGFSISFWMVLLIGRAPYSKLIPSFEILSIADASIFNLILWLSTLFANSSSCIDIISLKLSFVRVSKIIISSTLFKNSGLNVFLSSWFTFSWICFLSKFRLKFS